MDEQRYSRLKRYGGFRLTLGPWQASHCAVVGVGGLGSGLAMHLARLGVRRLTLVDRDVVGYENLGHQALYTFDHAERGLPKVEAAREVLSSINPDVHIDTYISEFNRHTAGEIMAGCGLVFDGLDNYFARLVLNDWCLMNQVPYFYAGVVRGELSARAIVPGITGCLRCLIDKPPAAGSVPTCASEGVFPPLLGVANALQLDAANRVLGNNFTVDDDVLYSLGTTAGPGQQPDWGMRRVKLRGPHKTCPACHGNYEYLDGVLDDLAVRSCSGGSAEINLTVAGLDLELVAQRLKDSGEFVVRQNRFCVAAERGDVRFTVFPAGKIVQTGSPDETGLNRFVATYLGI